jgi:hypothetical protein
VNQIPPHTSVMMSFGLLKRTFWYCPASVVIALVTGSIETMLPASMRQTTMRPLRSKSMPFAPCDEVRNDDSWLAVSTRQIVLVLTSVK